MVVTVGETTTEFPIKAPGFQVYVVAPLPVKVVVFPAQIDVEEAVAETAGLLTNTSTVCVAEHPKASNPVTV